MTSLKKQTQSALAVILLMGSTSLVPMPAKAIDLGEALDSLGSILGAEISFDLRSEGDTQIATGLSITSQGDVVQQESLTLSRQGSNSEIVPGNIRFSIDGITGILQFLGGKITLPDTGIEGLAARSDEMRLMMEVPGVEDVQFDLLMRGSSLDTLTDAESFSFLLGNQSSTLRAVTTGPEGLGDETETESGAFQVEGRMSLAAMDKLFGNPLAALLIEPVSLISRQSGSVTQITNRRDGFSGTATLGGSNSNMSSGNGVLEFGSEFSDMTLTVSQPGIPEVTIGLDGLGFGGRFPFAPGPDGDLGSLSMSFQIDMSDPFLDTFIPAELNGDRSAGLDISFSVPVSHADDFEAFRDLVLQSGDNLEDLLEEHLEAMVPGDLTIDRFRLNVLGASLSVTGGLSMNSVTDLPQGEITIIGENIDSLISALSNAGVIPANELFGYMMMMEMFMPRNESGQRRTVIALRDGRVLVNNMPLPF